MRPFLLWFAALPRMLLPVLVPFSLSLLSPSVAQAGPGHPPAYIHRWAEMEVFDRTAGHPLPVHVHRGRLYVAGEPGHQYELRVSNRSDERLLAVTSVDGVNVITGDTADERQTGYVLDPWDGVDIQGWRKSMDDVATFYFTRLSDSYAARTGRPENVGVIGVALFRERRPCCRQHPFEDGASVGPQASAERAESPAAEQYSSRRDRDKLGTGHGHREASQAQYVDFQRASNVPEETIAIYYDSRKNLIARGVIRESRHYAGQDRPDPFPGRLFAPDP